MESPDTRPSSAATHHFYHGKLKQQNMFSLHSRSVFQNNLP